MARHRSPRRRHVPVPRGRAAVAASATAVVAVVGTVLSLLGGSSPAPEGPVPAAPAPASDLRLALPTSAPAPTTPAPASATPAPAPSPAAAARPAPPTTRPPQPPRRAAEFPAQVVDLRNWYLTLPTGSEGEPDTVQPERLATYRSEFFAVDGAGDGVVFTANAGGVTTENSDYPRSELREMDGAEKASWDGRTGTHVMELDQAITRTPRVKPDVIAGQIHDGSDDVMQIHLSGTRLTVRYADGDQEVLLDGNYRLGTRFRVRIEASGGHVRVFHDGRLAADLPISSGSCYFKAGAYVNSNPDRGEDPDAVGQVVVHRLTVTHS